MSTALGYQFHVASSREQAIREAALFDDRYRALPVRRGNLDRNVWGTHMAGSFAKATAIGGLSVLVAAIALPRPARPCFLERESRNFNRLRLISFRLARTRA